MSTPQLSATTRIARATYAAMSWLVARDALFLARLVSLACKRLCGTEILPGATIGPRLIVVHGEGTIIGPNVIIGADCIVHHQVSIGYKDGRCPTIGDRVLICPGAKIFGDITIGDDAIVGANAVVVKDVGPGEMALAPAAKNTARRPTPPA